MHDGRFNGKSVLVTGGGSGIGRATVERFFREGAERIFVLDRSQERLERLALDINGGHRIITLLGDVSDVDDCVRAMQSVQQEGSLDILVSNAAAWAKEPFLEMRKASWDRVLAVSLTAGFVLGQLAARMMTERGGVILYTASISAFGASRNNSAYAVSKAGLVNLAKGMAFELGPYGIRVNCVSPGPTDTPQGLAIVGEARMRQFRKRFPPVPLGTRMGRPEEMASAFAFLASDDASYITGENLVVDGGLMSHAYSSSDVVVEEDDDASVT